MADEVHFRIRLEDRRKTLEPGVVGFVLEMQQHGDVQFLSELIDAVHFRRVNRDVKLQFADPQRAAAKIASEDVRRP